jgi:hypothetical protein
MDYTQLSKAQLVQLSQLLYRPTNFLNRLERRMSRLGFPPNDPLYVAVVKAQTALHELSMIVHYASCSSGVGRAPRADSGGNGRAGE